MRGSREIVVGLAIVLTLLACLLFLRRKSEPPPHQVTGHAGFVATRPSDPNPAINSDKRHHEGSGSAEAAPTTASPNVSGRRSADPRFPAQLDLLVLDWKTRLPIRGATVTAENRATRETVAEQVLPEGRGTMNLPTGAFYLSFQHPDYEERGLWIELNNNGGLISRQTMELRREAEVTGTVHDQNGAPVSGAAILLFGGAPRHARPEIVTGADGKFTCRVPVGPINGTATKGENRAGFDSQVAAAGPNVLDITLPIVSATISFTGRVINQKAEPIEGAVVRVLRPSPPRRESGYSRTTEEDGTFAFTLPPFSDCVIVISAAGAQQRIERISLSADVQRDFVIDSEPAFTVTVLTPDGEVLTKGFRVEGVGGSAAKITRLRNGKFCSTGYPIEIRAIAIESGYGNSEVARLSAYEPEVTLRIEPGGSLSGRAVDPSGRPITRFSYLLLQGPLLYVSHSLIDSPDGSFAIRHVAPGNYTLNIVADGYRLQGREIQLEAGRDCFAEMILQKEPPRTFGKR